LLLVHGWPGSFVEFLEIIPMLTDPVKYGGSDSDAWNVVIPSIPGYTFSERPHKTGFTVVEAALIFTKLMKRLDYNKFAYQGGDWGGPIGISMAMLNPNRENCVAAHLNMIVIPNSAFSIFQTFVASFFPDLVFDKRDQNKVLPVGARFTHVIKETGYMHLQSTRPYSVAQALSDSPAGLLSYIVEKFYVWSDCSGNIYNAFTKDQILTNIMIYYVTNSISSSMAFYKENVNFWFVDVPSKVDFPVAVGEFKDISNFPQSWIENYFPNLLSYTQMPKGGHFAAMEQPLLLAQDLWKFKKLIEW